MMWAKQPRRLFSRPRMAMMSIYTVTICLISLAAFASTTGDYRITLSEAEERLAEELGRKGVAGNLEVNIIGRRSQDMVRRAQPVVMDVADMDIDESGQRFTASLHFATEADLNRPAQKLGRLMVSGRWEEMVEVPVVKFRLGRGDIIRAHDIEWQQMALSRTRRDTIMDEAELIGKSPVRSISPSRPVRESEIQNPSVVHRHKPVKMTYETDHITIRAVGTAMEDGAIGDRIKVRNDDSGTEIDAVVTDSGWVEVIPPLAVAANF